MFHPEWVSVLCCVCFPATAHFTATAAVESNIAVNAKGPLSNCLLLIMMMRRRRVPPLRPEKGVLVCGMQISGTESWHWRL